MLEILVLGGALTTYSAVMVLPEKSSFMGPEGLALGGALVANENRSDFIYSNPASPAFEKKYTLGAKYTTAGDQLGAQITDTSSSVLGGSVAYSRREFKKIAESNDASLGNFNRKESQIAVALMSRVVENVAIGVTGRYYSMNPTIVYPKASYWTGDVGVLVALSPTWKLGLVGQDLLADDAGYSYRSFLLGVEGRPSSQFKLMAQVDFVRDPEGLYDTGFVESEAGAQYRIGTEYSINNEIHLRVSYASLSSWKTNFLGAGFSYKKEKFSLDYGFRSALGVSKGLTHAVGLSVDL